MAAPYRSGQALGWWLPGSGASTGTQVTNAAANWIAYSFVADSARTLSAIRLYVSALNGTLGANDITADLYDSTGSSGVPGSAIESGKVPSATITGAGWYSFTGFTTTLAAAQEYWIVIKNVNGTPATNYATFRHVTMGNGAHMLGSNLNRQSWGRATSTNSGSTWSTSTPHGMMRVDYTDGYDGVPIYNVATAGSGDGVYSSRESGVVFTSPYLCLLRASGAMFNISNKSGSPTGSPRLRLWETQDSTPVVIATATLLTTTVVGGFYFGYFDSGVVTVRPNTVYRLTVGETTQSDASANRYNNLEISWDTDSNSSTIRPWNGTCRKTYFDGSSWTDTDGSIFQHALYLDTAQEFFGSPQSVYQLGVM